MSSAAALPRIGCTFWREAPGTGKTTLALQFLLHGAAEGEAGLYVTLSETTEELRAVAETHGWSLAGLTIFELVSQKEMEAAAEQSVLHPAPTHLLKKPFEVDALTTLVRTALRERETVC